MGGSFMRDAAAERLIERKAELARAITARLYDEMPELLEKYGERGRARCLEDMQYNIEHLAPAVALGELSLFSLYCVWLRDMLAARGVGVGEIVRSLRHTDQVVSESFPTEEALLISEALAAGLSALAGEAP